LASVLSRIALVQNAGASSVDGPDAQKIVGAAAKLAADDVQLFYQIAILGRRDLALAPDEHSGFTMTMLRMLSLANGRNFQNANRSPDKATAASASADLSSREYRKAAPVAVADRTASSKHVKEPALPSTEYLAVPSANAAVPFSGDWPSFIARLNFNGMAGMLAKQCVFRSFADGILELALPAAQKHLAEKAFQEKLKSELLPHFGSNLRMNIRIGDVAGKSLAAVEDGERSARQIAAEAAILSDPFINNLKQEFGVEVVPSSIRPANT
jgi:DNA polymerase-3 subunit gamma/tau